MKKNVTLSRMAKMTPFRKIALGTWETTYDPSIYGTLRVRMDKALAYIDDFRTKTGRKLTVTHLFVKVLANILKECPEANAIIRWNKIYLRKNVDVSVLVLMKDGDRIDLSAAMLRDADTMSLVDIIDALETKAELIRNRKDKNLEQTRQSMQLIPSFLIGMCLKLISLLTYAFNLDLSRFGLPRDAFGGGVVTSIGSLGLDVGYVPLVPYSRVPIFVAPGEITEEAVVEDGEIKVGNMLNLNVTLDHRVVDGGHAAKMSAVTRAMFDDPYSHFDRLS